MIYFFNYLFQKKFAKVPELFFCSSWLNQISALEHWSQGEESNSILHPCLTIYNKFLSVVIFFHLSQKYWICPATKLSGVFKHTNLELTGLFISSDGPAPLSCTDSLWSAGSEPSSVKKNAAWMVSYLKNEMIWIEVCTVYILLFCWKKHLSYLFVEKWMIAYWENYFTPQFPTLINFLPFFL